AEDGIRDGHVTGVQTCALPISGTTHQTLARPSLFSRSAMEQFNSPNRVAAFRSRSQRKERHSPGIGLVICPLADSPPPERRHTAPGCLRASPPLSVGAHWPGSLPAAGPVGSLPYDPKPYAADDQYAREENRPRPQAHARLCPPSLPRPIVASVRGLRPRLRRYGPRPATL